MKSSTSKEIYLAEARGMCAGVRRALDCVEKVLAETPGGIYVLNEIVHNTFIVEKLKRRGVVFVRNVAEVPANATLIFSAHGVSRAVEAEAAARSLNVVDATCPLVKKIHRRAAAGAGANAAIILVGHRGHPEVTGTLGRADGEIHLIETEDDLAGLPAFPPSRPVWLLTQTTLDPGLVDRLRARLLTKIPQLADGGGICYATRERQQAVRAIARHSQLVVIIGSPGSSNSNRLRETAAAAGARAVLIDRAAELPDELLAGVSRVGVSAGASAPDALLDELLTHLRARGFREKSLPPPDPTARP